MARKGSLIGAGKAATSLADLNVMKQQVEAGQSHPARVIPPPVNRASDDVTTAINIPRDALNLLRLVAVRRANNGGGRASVSAVLAKLVQDNRAALELEAEG